MTFINRFRSEKEAENGSTFLNEIWPFSTLNLVYNHPSRLHRLLRESQLIPGNDRSPKYLHFSNIDRLRDNRIASIDR